VSKYSKFLSTDSLIFHFVVGSCFSPLLKPLWIAFYHINPLSDVKSLLFLDKKHIFYGGFMLLQFQRYFLKVSTSQMGMVAS